MRTRAMATLSRDCAVDQCCSDPNIVQLIISSLDARIVATTSILARLATVNKVWRDEAKKHSKLRCEEIWPGILQKWPQDDSSVRQLFKLLFSPRLPAEFTDDELAELREECEMHYPGVAGEAFWLLHNAVCPHTYPPHAAVEELVAAGRMCKPKDLAPKDRLGLDASNVLLLISSTATGQMSFRKIFQLSECATTPCRDVLDLGDDDEGREATPYIRLPVPELRDAERRTRWIESQKNTVDCFLLNRRTMTKIDLSAHASWHPSGACKLFDLRKYDNDDEDHPDYTLPIEGEDATRYRMFDITLPDRASWPGGAAAAALRRSQHDQPALTFRLALADSDDAAFCLAVELWEWDLDMVGTGAASGGDILTENDVITPDLLDSDIIFPWRLGCYRAPHPHEVFEIARADRLPGEYPPWAM